MKSIQRTKPVADRITIVDANGAIVSRFVGDTVTAGEKSISQADDEAKAKFVLDHYDNLRPQKADENANSLYGSGEGVGSGMMGSGGYGGLGDDYTGGRGKGSALGSSGGGSRGRGKRPGPGGSQ